MYEFLLRKKKRKNIKIHLVWGVFFLLFERDKTRGVILRKQKRRKKKKKTGPRKY